MTVRRRAAGAKGARASRSGPTPISSTLATPPELDSLTSSIADLTIDVPLSNPPKRPKNVIQPFPFLDLPSELRLKVYEYHFANTGQVLDLDTENYKRIHKVLSILRVCRQVYIEASHCWWTTHVVRLFPIYGKFFKTKKPLLARLTPRQRACISTMELRLGPGWNRPPRGWAVNDGLGLTDCTRTRRIKIFVECDPSNDVFKGFRKSDDFYAKFSSELLDSVLERLPRCETVEFDANPSVKKSGSMMQALLQVVENHGRRFAWGPLKGWDDGEEFEPPEKKPDHSPIGTRSLGKDVVGIPGFEGMFVDAPNGHNGQGQSIMVLA